MLTTNGSNSRYEDSKSVKNTLKEMMGPVSDQGDDLKLKILLGLGFSNEKASFSQKLNEGPHEEMTTLDINSNNSKDSNLSKPLPENLNLPRKVQGMIFLIQS